MINNAAFKFELYKEAIKLFGPAHQSIVAIEELSELQKEVTKAIRGGDRFPINRQHMCEEIADVEIMLEQLRIIYNLPESEIFVYKDRKLKRLARRIIEKREGKRNVKK